MLIFLWPARFLYREDWVTQRDDWNSQEPFLKREELPTDTVSASRTALGLISVRVAGLGDGKGDSKLYIIGGEDLDRDFLSSFALPAGMRALLYREPQSIVGASGPLQQTAALAPLIDALRKQRGDEKRTWLAHAISQLDDAERKALFAAGGIIKRLAEK